MSLNGLVSLSKKLPPGISLNRAAHDTPSRHRLRCGLFVLFLISATAYFGWRLSVLNPDAFVYSLLFYLAELLGTAVAVSLSFVAWRRLYERPSAAPPGHAVDVFITTYDESVGVVRRTVLGALNMDYPHKTWLLDDGDRPEMKALANELGCRYLPRRRNTGAKAGNLNNALRHANGEFIALFDADHVPQRNFLTRLLGYFRDPQVCFVQTPQDFYNLNSFQHGRDKYRKRIWHDTSWFHNVGQSGRQYWNAATFCGCSAIMRRSALDEIGGFPEQTVTEDMHAAVRMQKRGYRTLFHAEPLAFGIAPVGFRDYLRQRLRWGEGNLQVCRLEGLPFSRLLAPGQLLCYAALTWPYLAAWARVVLYSAPVVLLVAGIPPIISDPATFAGLFFPYLLLGYLLFEEISRGYGDLFQTEKFAMAQLGSGLAATGGLFRRTITFRISSKRLTTDFQAVLLLPQIAVLAASLAAIAYAGFRYSAGPTPQTPVWLAAIVSMIALYHAALAFLVIKNALRVSKLADEEYLHPVPLPAEMSFPDRTTRLLALNEISVDRFIFEAAPDPQLSLGAQAEIKIYLPECEIDAPVQIERIEQGAGRNCRYVAQFRWRHVTDRDRLDLALHAGRWYRPIVGFHENWRTPYDTFHDLIRTGSLQASARPDWRPAVYTLQGDRDRQRRLCYVAKNFEGESNAVLTFDPIAPHSELVLVVPLENGTETRTVLAGPQISGRLVDEEALDVVGGRIITQLDQELTARQDDAGSAEIIPFRPSADGG